MRIFMAPEGTKHRTPPGFPECPERVTGLWPHLEQKGWDVVHSLPQAEVEAAILAVHDPDYVRRFRRAVERGDGLLDSADNPLSAGTWDTAESAVAASLAAAEWMLDPADSNAGRSAFVATRPPGHHAEKATAMGFCYFNNVAVVAEHLVRHHGLERVAIFDFDVHHGNGTQHLFEDRADIAYVSTHQFPFYPGTGAAHAKGLGAGRGATLNVPLEAGTGDEGFEEAFEQQVFPFLREFAPDFLLISAGFDAWIRDPLGGMQVSEEGFRSWGQKLGHLAQEVCGGRMVSLLEGGYDLERLPVLVERYLEGLSEAV